VPRLPCHTAAPATTAINVARATETPPPLIAVYASVAITPAKAAPRAPKHGTDQPWKSGGLKNTRSFQKVRTPRKVGGS